MIIKCHYCGGSGQEAVATSDIPDPRTTQEDCEACNGGGEVELTNKVVILYIELLEKRIGFQAQTIKAQRDNITRLEKYVDDNSKLQF